MGITERKERDKQEMRENIIRAAMHIFMTDGYESASIRKIADKIEYSPATIYLYYKDKDELLYDVQAECFKELVGLFNESVAEHPYERLLQICNAYMKFGLENPDKYELMFVLKAPMNKIEECEGWENSDMAFGCLVDAVKRCIEQDLIRFTDPMEAVMTIWSFGHGIISLNLSCRMKIMEMPDDMLKAYILGISDIFFKLIKK